MHIKTLSILFLATTTTACIAGNGRLVNETRTADPFTGIDANNGIRVFAEVTPSSADRVDLNIRGDENLMRYLRTETVGDTLFTDMVENVSWSDPMRVDTTLTGLTTASANNGADVRVEGISEPKISVWTNNGGFVSLQGKAGELWIEGKNGGDARLNDLEVVDAWVDIKTGAEVEICATGKVTGHVATGAELVVNCGGDTSELAVHWSGDVD